MAEVKQSLTAAGSLLLAAATGLPALGLERSSRRPTVPPPEQATPSPEQIAPRLESIAPEVSETSPIEPDCEAIEAPRPRFRPFAEWRQRRKAHCRDVMWGYPEEFEPKPLGAAVNAIAEKQVARGQEARMVLYEYDFLPSSDQLKPRGKTGLAKMSEWMAHGAAPLLIEPTPGRPDLDEARRAAVWRELQCGPAAVPLEMIVIGRPDVLGLRGGEALLVDKNLMMQTSARGTAMGGGGGGGLMGGGGMGGGMGAGMTGGVSGGTSSGSTGSSGTGY